MVTVKHEPIHETELRDRLDYFELRFEVPSEKMITAFLVDGRLCENEDYLEWRSTYAAWKLCRRGRGVTASAV